jgi:hypothetical protein
MQPIPSRPRERFIVYVDGFNLYNGLHSTYGHTKLWLDLVGMAKRFRPREQLVQVKYFTAPVLGDPGAQSRQAHYAAALEALHPHHIEVIWGRYQKKRRKCSACGTVHKYYEEKETDVNIAVSLQNLMPASFDIRSSVLTQNQMPQSFVAGSATYTRPSKWV